MKKTVGFFVLFVCVLGILATASKAFPWTWAGPPLVIVGDSLGEGVQSADANLRTQPYSYGVWVARQAGLNLVLPYIISGPLGVVGDTSVRYRLFPYTRSSNLAVSGADSWSVLNDRALALSPRAISSETELVLFPRTGSQIEIVEALKPTTVLCWIGSNDVLSAVLAFDQLNSEQIPLLMTTPEDFRSNFETLLSRLGASAQQVVLADIPDVTHIGFLLDNNDLNRFLGPGNYLAEGSRTTVAALFSIRLGLADLSILQDPNYVLDSDETALIQERTNALNRIIYDTAEKYGFPVVKISEEFKKIAENPPSYAGVPITPRYLGGLFSLDGVHPSNIGHALIANEFLSTLKIRYGWNVPKLSESMLNDIAAKDPFVDLDGDGRVLGRPLAGMLETLGPILGISGDVNESVPERTSKSMELSVEDRHEALNILDTLRDPSARGTTLWTPDQVRQVFRELFRL